jgi:hypothetical protein
LPVAGQVTELSENTFMGGASLQNRHTVKRRCLNIVKGMSVQLKDS